MDRSILSEPRLLQASRDFVCARLITYQNSAESKFLKSLGASTTGGVLNTSFALLAPDGKTVLSRTGRAPKQLFRGSEVETLDGLIAAMKRITDRYKKKHTAGTADLPYLASTKIALSVASCDNQPLVVVLAKTKARRELIEEQLSPLVWDPDFRGRFAFAHASRPAELGMIEKTPWTDSIMIVQPDTYGLEGTVIAKATTFSNNSLRRLLQRGLSDFRVLEKDRRKIRAARRQGIKWQEDTTDREPDPNNTRRARRSRFRTSRR